MCALRLPLLVLLLVTPPALAQQTADQPIDDATISARVEAALVENELTGAHDIHVETQSQVVRLSGFAESEKAKLAAESAARSVEGVTEVRNALTVRENDLATSAVIKDSVIAAKVKEQLADEAGLDTASAIDVEVRRGTVQLSGFVDSEEERSQAEEITNNVKGVVEVRNIIDVIVSH
jgi:hyperosmotically inducible periplasmic protein